MKIHGPSFAFGFMSGMAVTALAERFRPVGVEMGALALQLARMGRSIVEIQRERLEDFWYDVQDASNERAQLRRNGRQRRAEASEMRGAGRA